MKDFLLLFRIGPRFQTASPTELQQIMLKSKDWVGELSKTGRLNGVVRLTRNGAALKGENRNRIDGPHIEGNTIINGYLGIKAADLDEAIEIAKGNPIFDYDGMVEVREIAPN